MESGEGRREIDDDSFLLFNIPASDVSSLLKDFLSNSDIYNFHQENNAHFSTFCLLNKASIVHSIRQRIANRSVPEWILDSLQIIERLDRQQGLPISDSMREAFCAVAVHCTLTSLPVSWPCYFDAVQRIWRFRIRNLEDAGTSNLVGPNLRVWRDDLEAALWDSETSKRLLRINTQDEALVRISVYIEEVRSSMKPAFLALSSSSRPSINRQAPRRRGTYKVKREILGVNPQRRCKLRSSHRYSKSSVDIAASEEDRPSCSKYGFLSTPEVNNKLQDALNPSTLSAGVTDPLPQALEVGDRVASDMARKKLHTEDILENLNKDKDVPATSVNPTKDVPIARKNLHTEDILENLNKDKEVPATSVNPTKDVPIAGKNMHTEDIVENRHKDKDVPATSVNPATDVPMARKILHTEDIVEDRNKDKDVPATSVAPTVGVLVTSVNPTIDAPVTSVNHIIGRAQAKRVAVAGKILHSARHPCSGKRKGILRVNSQARRQLGSSHRCHGRRVTIADSVGEPSCGNYGSLSSPEIKKVQDALKSSVADLQAAVTDPLPEALEVAERVASYMAGKNLHNKSIVEEGNKDKGVPATSANLMDSNQAKRLEPDMAGKNLHAKPVEKDNSKMDKSVPPPSFNPHREPAQSNDANLGNQASLHQNSVPRPSLMERNGTARTYEWEDSIDVSAEGTTSCSNRCLLPSPKVKHASPLKEHVTQKWVRKRKMNRWSLLEEEALMKGVKEFGPKWKLILKSYPEAFNADRIPVDLKDKWRNMCGR